MEAPVAGIDVSKDKLVVYFQGKYYEFQNNKQGFEGVKQVLPKGCKVAIESTGVYHINLAKYLGKEYDVRIINPLVLKKFKNIRGKKSDKNDAKKLAELVISMGSEFTTSEAKELTSQWDFITRSIVRVKNRLRRDLILLGYKDSLSKKNLNEVLRGEDNIVLSEVRFLLDELERLEVRKREIEEELEDLVPKDSLIFTIPGIGRTLGCIILARVGDVKRFGDKKRFVAYCGLDPLVESSGKSVVSRGISRRGDAVLRRAFYLAALTAIKVNPIIKRFYEEHKENLKGKKLITACARKLAVITWAVLYYNKPFDANE
ncbi:IS110 family transposase [Saccharolobus solfataricus]|uniref:Transposon ISC1190 n=3 Tax=Saccharolobus solfataricus TaxID=2287 RepID=Q97VS0_SACS2|nr:IS110-like element ISC1190 family transposase [Saccharolobus solfataricus]AAK42671.1 Transposon ISC1190 [Saccharolobus solfataricus P2]AKA72767.1 IS110 family transposase [Saccharolobus solfataricus]AKA75466.1 IS110 family transposase [Saccharolobus solfataricus]AKA78159.1 IS110 family transposase [Saccharolobus solfataricus]AZF67278.1 IS110 family transposase [Saccharolobus solfataricus]